MEGQPAGKDEFDDKHGEFLHVFLGQILNGGTSKLQRFYTHKLNIERGVDTIQYIHLKEMGRLSRVFINKNAELTADSF